VQKELKCVRPGKKAIKNLLIGHIPTDMPTTYRLTASIQAKIIAPIIADGFPPG
jgi:hypothetical protein